MSKIELVQKPTVSKVHLTPAAMAYLKSRESKCFPEEFSTGRSDPAIKLLDRPICHTTWKHRFYPDEGGVIDLNRVRKNDPDDYPVNVSALLDLVERLDAEVEKGTAVYVGDAQFVSVATAKKTAL